MEDSDGQATAMPRRGATSHPTTMMKEHLSGIQPTRAEDFPQWFQSVVKAAEIAELDHVRGCMVIRPWGYGVWELMRDALDREIKATGHENAYFPLFIPLSYLQEEADHVSGFAKEMAVVTHHRLEEVDGVLRPAGELSEPLIVRPSSETIIGRSFAKWITSYRDLPLLINQWANVVRWELRPRVLLRTTEFLWQEGHTAHATEGEAREETERMLALYREFAETTLAMPVVAGAKPDSERFPGAVMSLSIEAMMQDGKALQAGTSHFMGQNFSRAMTIRYASKAGPLEYAFTTSWGVSTRLLGAVVMTHGDDLGLKLPPAIAPKQIVVVSLSDDAEVIEACARLAEELSAQLFRGSPLRVHLDRRDLRPLARKWEWFTKGTPAVFEIGQRDLNDDVVTLTTRTEAAASLRGSQVARARAAELAGEALEKLQRQYLDEATRQLSARTIRDVPDLAAFRSLFEDDVDAGFVRAPWCGEPASEGVLKPLKVSIRCLPFDQPPVNELGPCVLTGRTAVTEAIFARAY